MRTLYLNPTRREQEKSFFETFCSLKKELHIKNPEDYRRQPPNPDYIFPLLQKRIGLEVTTLVLDKPGLVLNKSGKTTSLVAIRSAQNESLKKAVQMAKGIGLEPIEVQVQFRSDSAPIVCDEAAKELVDFLKEEMPEIDDTKTRRYFKLGLKYFKQIIISLGTVNGRKWLQSHRFRRIHSVWVTKINPDKIQFRIDEKQKWYSKYIQNCDECWLLIGVDEWTAPEAFAITEELDSHVFSGDFQRLFFLRNIEGSVIELKISHK